MIDISDLSVRYRRYSRIGARTALDRVNLSIPQGLFGLLGPNGAGKSTLLRVLATVLRPTSGDALVAGNSVRRQRRVVRTLIGYIPQDSGFYPQLRVWETLDYLALLSGLNDGRVRKERVAQALAAVNLTERAQQRVKALSGGMRQRFGIAQALLHQPRVLIADEPTSGLDPSERVHFRSLLATLAVDRTVILSTHIVSDIASACPQLAVLHHGCVLFTGSAAALAEQASCRLWEATVPDHQVGALLQDRWPIARLTQTAEGTLVRIIGPVAQQSSGLPARLEGLPDARPVTDLPSLEEGYLALIGREGALSTTQG